eukprot:5332268-Pyramimonas_sp.AAC.1
MYDELGGDDDEREAAPTATFNIPGHVWEDASAAVDARGLAPGVTAWERQPPHRQQHREAKRARTTSC